MKNSTFENRTKDFNKGSKAYKFAKELLTTGNIIRPCYNLGSGRFGSTQDHTNATIQVLKTAGLITFLDFTYGNDAPRGGLTGSFIRLTTKGKRKMIK